MDPRQLSLRLSQLQGPGPETPELQRGYEACGKLAAQFFHAMKSAQIRLNMLEAETLSPERTVCGALYLASALGIDSALASQMDYRVIGAVRRCESAAKSSVAQSIAANCSARLALIEAAAGQVRAADEDMLDRPGGTAQRSGGPKGSEAVRIAEMLLISFELLRRETEGLAALVRGEPEGAAADIGSRDA